MTITAVKVLLQDRQSDVIMLQTELPEATWPFEGLQSLDFRCAQGKALEYVAQHFAGVPLEILDYRKDPTTQHKFSK